MFYYIIYVADFGGPPPKIGAKTCKIRRDFGQLTHTHRGRGCSQQFFSNENL